MIILVLLFAFGQFCLASKPIDYSPLLKYLDDKIVKELIEPNEGRGDKLIKYVEKYNHILVDARNMIDQDVYEAFVKAQELYKIGGPQFLKSHLDRGLAKHIYNWTEEHLDHMEEEFEFTRKTWQKIVNELPAAEKRFVVIHEKEEMEKQEQQELERIRVEKGRKEEEEFHKRVRFNTESSVSEKSKR